MLQNFGTALSREQMKNVKGGDDQTLQSPDGSFGGGYMCCWTGTSNCSVCVPAAQPTCVSGATAKAC